MRSAPRITNPAVRPPQRVAELPTAALVRAPEPRPRRSTAGPWAAGARPDQRTSARKRPPRQISRYVLVARLGRGGMGEVFRARDTRLERDVAVKLIATELVGDGHAVHEFERECRLAAAIEHPHVLPIYDAGEAEGRVFLTMRYVDGPDLDRLIAAEGPLTPRRALRVVSQIGCALNALHGRGLVHKDVKPSNVLMTAVDGADHVYLSDFGVAVRSTIADDGSTRTPTLAGTLGYIAPEQLRGETVDARADIYALGCVLFALLAGRGPFGELDKDQTTVAHLLGHAPTLRGLGIDAPADADRVIRRAMQIDPDRRYSSAREMIGDASDALLGPPACRRPRRYTQPGPRARIRRHRESLS